MRFDILTIFPEMFASPLGYGILRRAIDAGTIQVDIVNIRDYTTDKHRTTDDYPYGGGSGMVMKPEPIAAALDFVRSQRGSGKTILLSPRGRRFCQTDALSLSREDHVVLICGRYEGIDERVRTGFVDEDISIGDYVLSGGELAAMVILDAVSRHIPGVLGCAQSCEKESFSDGLLEYPQYTRPPSFYGMGVPEVLVSGNHAAIAEWRRKEALRATLVSRPDLLDNIELSEEDKRFLEEAGTELSIITRPAV